MSAHGFRTAELLMQLWKKWFVDAPYEKTSKKWKELGFQRDDPRSASLSLSQLSKWSFTRPKE
jgi:hypothetical protein